MKLPDIRGLKNSIYFKNVLTLVSGTSVAQLIPVLISPILTRLYSPEDFGLLALIVSISTIFGSLVSLKYELAIVLPKENKKALHITLVSLIFSFVFSVILLFVFIIFKGAISELFNNKYLNEWLVILPLIIFLISAYNSLRFYSLRNNNFKIIDAKKRKPKKLGVFQFKINEKYRALYIRTKNGAVVFKISDHQ